MNEKSQAWCVVNAVPALVVPVPVRLLIYDGEGRERYNVNSAAIDCYILPDVVVTESLTAGATPSWSFDQEWKELIPMN